MTKILRLVLGLSAIAVVVAGCASSGGMEWLDLNTYGDDIGPMFTVVGTVQVLSGQGGTITIADTSGTRYVPVNLPESFKAPGLRVELRARRVNRLQPVGTIGDLIDIHRIRRLGTSTSAAQSLSGTSWRLGGFESTDAAASAATIAFSGDSMVAGSAGCNRYFGTVTTTPDSIDFGELASTRRMCGPATMQQEEAFLKALTGTVGYEVSGKELVIKPAGGARPLRFDATPGK